MVRLVIAYFIIFFSSSGYSQNYRELISDDAQEFSRVQLDLMNPISSLQKSHPGEFSEINILKYVGSAFSKVADANIKKPKLFPYDQVCLLIAENLKKITFEAEQRRASLEATGIFVKQAADALKTVMMYRNLYVDLKKTPAELVVEQEIISTLSSVILVDFMNLADGGNTFQKYGYTKSEKLNSTQEMAADVISMLSMFPTQKSWNVVVACLYSRLLNGSDPFLQLAVIRSLGSLKFYLSNPDLRPVVLIFLNKLTRYSNDIFLNLSDDEAFEKLRSQIDLPWIPATVHDVKTIKNINFELASAFNFAMNKEKANKQAGLWARSLMSDAPDPCSRSFTVSNPETLSRGIPFLKRIL